MPNTSDVPPGLYIGLDAGGSSTDAMGCVHPDGDEVVRSGPAANLQRRGVAACAEVLTTLIQEVRTALPDVPVRAICAGVAGAGRSGDQEALMENLRNLLPDVLAATHLHIVHDAPIALEAAFEGAHGIILIVGTGSIAYAKTVEGEQLRAGGWGYLIGDEGSGNAIGVRGLRAVAAALDGGPATQMQALLSNQHNITTPDDLIRSVYRDDWPVQRMAPLVVQAAAAGDAVAQRLIAKQTRALARQVRWLAERAHFTTPRIALLGGLSKEAPYKAALCEALEAVLPGCQVQAPRHPPVVGAVHIAMRLRTDAS